MSGVEAYFMGGPSDREFRVVQCDDPMRPPKTVTVLTPPDLRFLRPDDVVRPVEHIYKLQPSQMDDGPLWVYAYAEPS